MVFQNQKIAKKTAIKERLGHRIYLSITLGASHLLRSQLRCCIYHAGLANWHDDEGSSLLLSSRPPQCVQRSGAPHQLGDSPSFNKKRDLYKAHDVPKIISIWNLSSGMDQRKPIWLGRSPWVPDFASASEVNFGHFMTCFKKKNARKPLCLIRGCNMKSKEDIASATQQTCLKTG